MPRTRRQRARAKTHMPLHMGERSLIATHKRLERYIKAGRFDPAKRQEAEDMLAALRGKLFEMSMATRLSRYAVAQISAIRQLAEMLMQDVLPKSGGSKGRSGTTITDLVTLSMRDRPAAGDEDEA